MTGARIYNPAPRALQSRRIRNQHGVDQRRALLLAEMVYGEARS